jgi:hypothetical protein
MKKKNEKEKGDDFVSLAFFRGPDYYFTAVVLLSFGSYGVA